MTKIYSRIRPDMLLHIIHRRTDFDSERNDIIQPDNSLQLAAMKLPEGKTFKPHYHIPKEINEMLPQESWVVISGSVRCILYDIDNTILSCPVLMPGDCSITLVGGHSYEVLQESRVLEFKSGPYTGVVNDKVYINQNI